MKDSHVGTFIKDVYNEIRLGILKVIVPEAFPLLRTIQLFILKDYMVCDI